MMTNATNFPSADPDARPYASWALPQPSNSSLIERAIAGTMIRSQSGGIAQLALCVCAVSLTGLLVLAMAVMRNGIQ